MASSLADLLAKHGVPCFYSPRSILGAQQWHDEIGAALKRCDWFVLVLSPDAVASSWVKRELLYALNARRFEGRIVPLQWRACDPEELSWTLPQFEWIDFASDFHGGCRELLRIWGIGLKQH